MANNYKHYTQAQREMARRTDIVDILRRMGETVKRAGSEYEWLDGGQKVTIKGNLWFHQYEQVGGDAVSFVQRYMDKTYVEAMEYLVGDAEGGTLKRSAPVPEKEAVPFELPERNDTMRRVYAYLLTRRGLDKEVVDTFARYGMIYESADYHNAVFVGYDRTRKPMHVSFRGTGSESKFRGNVPSSTPEYSFHWHGQAVPAPNRSRTEHGCDGNVNHTRPSQTLYVFESPIDMLSYISMHKENWKEHSYAACCGVSDRCMNQMLKDNPNIRRVKLCLDNDDGGHKATKRISAKLTERGIEHEILTPGLKDWNEDLQNGGNGGEQTEEDGEEQEDDEQCQGLQLLSS